MGKTTPKFSGGVITINGQERATNQKKGNDIVSNYQMTEPEKQLYDYSQNTLASAVPQINTFLPETWASFNKQLDAYTSQGVKKINEMYDPMLTNLKNDIASRFGNFDNSTFMDNLNKIESKRADSVSDFAQSVMAQQNSLINDELNRRYQYINLLNLFQNQPMQNALNYIASARNNTQQGNAYNQAVYSAIQQQQLGLKDYTNMANVLF